jgi:serine/threonine-protein kinase
MLLIVGLLVVFLAPRWSFLDYLDAYMFQLGTWLLPTPEVSSNIYTVNLPAELMQNPDKIKQLRMALNKLNKNKSAAVALIMPQLPTLDYKRSEADKQDEVWELTQGELTKLAWTLDKNKVLMGVPVMQQRMRTFIKADNESYIDYLQGMLFSKLSSTNIQLYQYNYDYNIFPYLSDPLACHKISLLWMKADNNIIADLVLAIYKQAQGIEKYDWLKSTGVHLETELIHTDYAAQVMGYFSVLNYPVIETINLDSLLLLHGNEFSNKIFILSDNDKALLSVANNVASVISGALYHTPAWASWAKKLAFIVIFIYLLFFVARLQKHTSYLLTILLLFSALVFQYGLLVIQSVWLPLISLYVFLILGHFIMRLKKTLDSKMQALMLRSHEALWHLGQYQYENGDHEKALSNLFKCSPTSDVLETMYNIGLGFERRRQYDRALQLYSELDVRDGAYKDVKKRLKTLLGVVDGSTGNHADVLVPGQAAKTLLMPDIGLQLPVFGRYEIERELGRGAMGVVYLGKDPKINRQVAIKTLDYSQFSEKELKTIKSRFFREAEAAGRLNHHNIVTVYDVGEEEGLAFIAMDYVQGQSLGEYVRVDSLLPIAEVYEVVAEVAEALDYAHSQNIVHRDIKPSNIMYDPETHKIKITDFGIARITDSVRTRTGSFMGSPAYMSPEQMLGANVDSRADIYALGVSFYQLLTGCLPFKADSIGTLAYIITNEKHRPVRDVRPELPASASRIVNRALRKKPQDRYNTGMDMAEAIRRGMPKGE